MPSLKLVYYPMGGRAVATRLILNHAKIPFEDVRMPGEELEKAMAAQPELFPCETVPVLAIDGGKTVLSQSHAIAMYAARLANMIPADALKATDIDEVANQLDDITNAVLATMGKEGDALKEAREAWVKGDCAKGLKRIDAIYARGSAEGPFLHGAEPTVADFELLGLGMYFVSGFLDHVPKDVMDAYPRVAKAFGAVMALPSVQEYQKANPAF